MINAQRTTLAIFLVAVTFFFSPQSSHAQQKKWVTVYYPMWAMRPLGAESFAIPPWEVNWKGITHVVHFNNSNVDSIPPFFKVVRNAKDSIDFEFLGITNPGDGNWIHWQDSLLTIAHRNGVKVLLNLSALEGSGQKSLVYIAADSARMQLLVNTMVAYAERKGYDGIEVDWEPPSNREDLSRLIRLFRRRLDQSNPRGLLIFSPGSGHWGFYDPTITNAMVDQLNLQLYDYVYAWGGPLKRSNVVWYTAPLATGDTPFGMEGQSWETRGPLQWIRAGHQKEKLGVGIPLFGYVMKGQRELYQPMKSNGDYGYAKYQDCLVLLQNGGTEGWDEERKVPFITGRALRTEGKTWWAQPGVKEGEEFFATYENPRSIRAKIEWMKTQGLGGIMLYDLTMDLDPTQPNNARNPLINIVREAVANGGF